MDRFSRHVPRLLRRQLLSNLLDQSLSTNDKSTFFDKSCKPSIESFHGSILFIDISGFTALSQRLKVEDLKIHINGYFKKILDIIEMYNGEVIKFAGDALFVVWQSRFSGNLGE